jgi:uncharacterized protein
VIVYADASALVKRYVVEFWSDEVVALTAEALAVGTSLISRAEVSSALARAVRSRVVDENGGRRAQRRFSREWPHLAKVSVTEALVSRAEALAWEYGLRGYDAVQLASAFIWRDGLGQDVLMATFDRELWEASARAGFSTWPEQLPNPGSKRTRRSIS